MLQYKKKENMVCVCRESNYKLMFTTKCMLDNIRSHYGRLTDTRYTIDGCTEEDRRTIGIDRYAIYVSDKTINDIISSFSENGIRAMQTDVE